jgi:DNA-binding response OmpR family regulator
VLLVDSDDDCRAIYATILRHGGFPVTVAACADAGLAMARQAPPGLVVLALTPPRPEALRVVRAFRAEPATERLPLVALSTIPSEDERERLLGEGLTAYLPKPCTPLELLAEVRRILER